MGDNVQVNTADELRQIINRIVKLETEKAEVAEDIKEVYAEAKGRGFDAAALRVLVKEQREDASRKAKRDELESILDIYRSALGDLDGTPLGQAAMERAVA